MNEAQMMFAAVQESFAQHREMLQTGRIRLMPDQGAAALQSLGESAAKLNSQAQVNDFIRDFPGERVKLLQPIPIHVRAVGWGGFMASFQAANISATGDDRDEAVANLAAELLDAFEDYLGEVDHLGPEPARQLGVLRSYLAPA